MKSLHALFFAVAMFGTLADLNADETLLSYEAMKDHPYKFTPAYGHASQNPGSPKYFRPGYGYQIPGFGNSANHEFNSTSYLQSYRNGIRIDRVTARGYYYTPWHLPRVPTRPKIGWPNW